MIETNKRRSHPKGNTGLSSLGDGQKLHYVSELTPKGNICRFKRVDSFHGYFVEIDIFSKCKGREDCQLMGRITAGNIESRVSFGQSFFLCLFQRIRVGAAATDHRREYIITGTIDDPVERFNLVGDQTVVKCPYERNTAAAACLEGD